jgi:hypothetical protein
MRPREVARLLRVSVTKIIGWIKSGKLRAINTASVQCGKPRYVILPRHLAEFEQRMSAVPPPKQSQRRRRQAGRDYYPGDD